MKRSYSQGQFVYGLMLFILSSCGSKMPENSRGHSEFTSVVELLEDSIRMNTLPKVDSQLQFSVMVTTIFQDSKGNFWFGSHGDGLCRYDGKQYTYFKAYSGLPGGMIREFAPGPDWSKKKRIDGGNQISSIQEDQDGVIWVRNGEDELCRFDGEDFHIVDLKGRDTLLVNQAVHQWEKKLDYLWFQNWRYSGVLCYDGRQVIQFDFPKPYSSVGGVSEVYRDRNGNLWFGTMGNGTYRYDGKSFERVNPKDQDGICRSVFHDETGRIWLTHNGGIGLHYYQGGEWINFIEDYRSNHKGDPLSEKFENSGIQSIEQDEKGDLWFGTFGNGLWRYDGDKLTHYTADEGLSIVTVKTLYKDREGQLWFGIGQGSVYGFNGESFFRFDQKE